jgi:glycosyltransferase involved in cell wall biosynthesis
MASIVIADDTGFYDGSYLETKPLGGTESSVIRFARAMARRGHDVTAFTNCEAPLVHEGVRWMPLRGAAPESCDLYIACQHPRLFHLVRGPKRVAVWTLWQPNEFKHYKQLARMWWYRPIPILTSLHQLSIYSIVLPRRDPHVVIPLGLPDDIRGLAPLKVTPPPEAIFASNVERNLIGLVRIWAERIWPRRRDAVLNIHGIKGIKQDDDIWKLWGGRFLPTDVSAEARSSIRVHATVPRADLIAAFRRSRVMIYLGHKVEAFCLAAAEAQALGVPCVFAPATVLPERVIDGVTGFVRGDPQQFADATLALLGDDDLWRRQHEAALKLRQGISWDEVAARFEVVLLSDRIPTDHS